MLLRRNRETSAVGRGSRGAELKNMWKRKEEEPSPSPEYTMTGSPASQAASAPQPPRPVEPQRTEVLRGGEVANIGKSVVVKGELSGSEDLVVDGEVEGSITLRGQTL